VENNIPELATCKRCVLSKTRTRVVIGSGPDSPSLMVIGEAPGRHEDEGGEPFIGRSGQLLFRLIEEETGLLRSDCFVTNVVKCRPPNNRTPNKTELGACRPWLDSQFIAVAPQFVLALGNTASRTVFNHTEPIGAVHGKVI
jgi:DNA polymerase